MRTSTSSENSFSNSNSTTGTEEKRDEIVLELLANGFYDDFPLLNSCLFFIFWFFSLVSWCLFSVFLIFSLVSWCLWSVLHGSIYLKLHKSTRNVVPYHGYKNLEENLLFRLEIWKVAPLLSLSPEYIKKIVVKRKTSLETRLMVAEKSNGVAQGDVVTVIFGGEERRGRRLWARV